MAFGFSSKRVVLFVLCSIVTVGLHAQATRTWVSGVGDDANPCSRTAPCKTFAGAISKTAAGGEINAIDSGGFGTVTITKAITINGAGVHASILASGVPGIVINAGVNDVVTLRNLSINGAGTTLGTNGVRWIAGKAVIIENCDIFNFSNRGVTAEVTTGGSLIVADTTIRSFGSFGLVVLPASGSTAINAVLDNVRVYGGTSNGVYIGNGAKALIRNCDISRNGNTGLQVEQTVVAGTEATLENTVISLNLVGIAAGGGATETRISNCTISNNTNNGFNFAGGTVVSFGNNRIRNNGGSNTPSSTAVPAQQ